MKIRVLLSLKLFFHIVLSLAEPCDRARTVRVQEGNLGQSPHFNWLGVLIVHLREWKKPRTAVTGIVLIKDQYALAHADDVARIPKKIFYKNSRAMFIPARDTLWFVKPSTFITHPDYQDSTLNSIAIIKLNLDNVKNNFPLTPICLPAAHKLKPSEHLYLTGITDDNKKMEKIIYKIQSLHEKACEEYYSANSTGLAAHKLIPSTYLCVLAPSIGYQCDWENGMVLVSNATGYFNLIGLAIHGPGCAAPARFMDLSPYIPWIHSVTGSAGGYDSAVFRRRHGNVQLVPNVPIHELYSLRGARRQNKVKNYTHEYEAYPFDVEKLKFHIIKPTDDKRSILITPLVDTWERYPNACSLDKKALYKEYFELRALDGLRGTVKYKLSLWDFRFKKCACVRLTVDSKGSPDAVLSFKEKYFDFKEDTQFLDDSGETPEEVFRYFPLLQRDPAAKTEDDWIKREEVLKPAFIKDEYRFYSDEPVLTYDLYIKFEFFKRAIMEFEMFAEGETLDFSNKSTTSSTTPCPMGGCEKDGKKGRRQLVSLWGVDNWEDNMVKMTSLVVDEEEPREAESAGRRERAPGAVVNTWLLTITCLRTLLFIH